MATLKSRKRRLEAEQKRLKKLEKLRLLGLSTWADAQEEYKLSRRVALRECR